MEKNEKGKNVLIGILIGIIVCLVIALVLVSYNKFMVKDESNTNNINTINSMSDTISQNKSVFGSLEKYFENYIKYIPLKYDNNLNLVSYSVSDLTDKEISMAVWRYIYKTKNGLSENSKLTKEEVLSYLNNYLNLNNYSIKTMQITNDNIFGLEERNGYYIISATPTEFDFPMFEVSDVSYDINTGDVKVIAREYYIEMGTSKKVYDKNIDLDIKYNGTNSAFNLIKMTVSK